MPTKIMKMFRYLLYAVLSNVLYGFILYNVYTLLNKYSETLAFLGNISLIIIGLALDEYTLKIFQSKKFVMQIKDLKKEDIEKNYRLIKWIMDSFVSFKTVLYLFYIFLLVAAQLSYAYPIRIIISTELSRFFHDNAYGILILVAFDMLIGQFSRDRERMKKVSAIFEENFTEDQE